MPDSGLFPTDAFRRVLNRVIREEGRELLQYYPGRGYPPLREFLAGYLLRFGLEVRPEEILIVNGSQQGFDLVARTLLDPGDFVAIEEPSYPRAMQVFRAFGAQLLPVPMRDGGLDPEHLDRLLERQSPKLLYCQPSAHNPTGLTMRPEARKRLLEVAARHRLPIMEDGFDGSLFFGPQPPAPLKALDVSGLVIYIGTFSKILFPGLRLGWIVAAPELIDRLEVAKDLADIHTSPLIQAAVYHFCRQRLLDRHQARVLREYGRRRAALLGVARQAHAARRDVDRERGRLLAAGDAARGAGRRAAARARRGARGDLHARERVLRGRRRRADAAAVLLGAAAGPDRRGHQAARRAHS